jgi:hypothetical protein
MQKERPLFQTREQIPTDITHSVPNAVRGGEGPSE